MISRFFYIFRIFYDASKRHGAQQGAKNGAISAADKLCLHAGVLIIIPIYFKLNILRVRFIVLLFIHYLLWERDRYKSFSTKSVLFRVENTAG